ncbi:MAG: fibrobacter succinogenes major paralogous domain-containing protein [bacterium]|nr:fibrobacter succinogenes major paralogous domain-containing protein [bacterium]
MKLMKIFILGSLIFTSLYAEQLSGKTIKIGKQEWTAENLDVNHYRNGDSIPQVQDAEEWQNLNTGAWCYYENNAENGKTYGKLYNWYAVNDPRGLAPKGWHIPTDEDWTTLVDYLGNEDIAGGKMKETDTTHWLSSNTESTNKSGFSARPGGYRYSDGVFSYIGYYGYWWSATGYNATKAGIRYIGYGRISCNHDDYNKKIGLSVRCVR